MPTPEENNKEPRGRELPENAFSPEELRSRSRLYDHITSFFGSSRKLNGRSGKQFIRSLAADYMQLKQGDRAAANTIVCEELDTIFSRYMEEAKVDLDVQRHLA